jgi:hypothetical protein
MYDQIRSYVGNHFVRIYNNLKSWWCIGWGLVALGLGSLLCLVTYARLCGALVSSHYTTNCKVSWVRLKRFVGLKRRV